MNGNTERAQCALSRVCIPKKRKRKAVKRIKQIDKTSKRVIKKKSSHPVPKVVIDHICATRTQRVNSHYGDFILCIMCLLLSLFLRFSILWMIELSYTIQLRVFLCFFVTVYVYQWNSLIPFNCVFLFFWECVCVCVFFVWVCVCVWYQQKNSLIPFNCVFLFFLSVCVCVSDINRRTLLYH